MVLFKATMAALFFFLATTTFAIGNVTGQVPAAEKEWTFLVFINGHNNLSPFADQNIIDMEKVGSTKDLNVVVEWGSESTTKTKRMYIQKSTDSTKVTSPSVMEMENHDMGDYKNLIDFVNWGAANYPAKHYFVSVWNHGSGWHRSIVNIKPMDISFDDASGNHITTEQLGTAISEIKKTLGHNLEIYGSDACLMQMIEVAGEMKGDVDYFVGSQETEPGEGWPYLPFLKKWAEKPTMTPAEVSVLLSKEYLAAYSGGVYGTKSVTFSAWDMSQLDGVYAAVTNLGKSLLNVSNTQLAELKKTAGYTQNFTYSDYADLGDFTNIFEKINFNIR
jgi:Clostripain family